MERPAYFGNLPYPPGSKKPCVIREGDQKKDFFSHEVPEESNDLHRHRKHGQASLRDDGHGSRQHVALRRRTPR